MQCPIDRHPAAYDLKWLKAKALSFRRQILMQAKEKALAFIAQSLGGAGGLAIVCSWELRHDPRYTWIVV